LEGGYASVHDARMQWQKLPANAGKCYWTGSDIGMLAGGCRRGDKCFFKDSHP
jgi:hypothetical protein